MAITTKLCELLGIEHPIVQGALGPWSSAELSAAISNAGALGSIGTAAMPPQRVRELLARMGELTDRPFCLNHTARPFVEESWRFGIEARPKLISYAIGDPGELPKRAHEAGILFMAQVHTPQQAELAAERGADAIVAQGAEAGGFCGRISTMALVPQVVDAVAPIPVLAAGGIADGRGLAAALALGAAGINIGTRFLSSEESPIRDSWRRRILEASSEEPVKVEFAARALPSTEGAFDTSPRALPTPFIEQWLGREDEDLSEARAEIEAALREGRIDELVPFTGQTAGMIDDVLPARTIVERLVTGAEEALARG